MADHVYHWKHGWIPLDHVAALSKAKGNHALAAKYMVAAHSPDVGIRSRQDVAKAVLDLPNISNPADRHGPREAIKQAAEQHGADDLLPKALRDSRFKADHVPGFRAHGLNSDGANRVSGGGYTEGDRVERSSPDFTKPGAPDKWHSGVIDRIQPRDDGNFDVTFLDDRGHMTVEIVGKRGGNRKIRKATGRQSAATDAATSRAYSARARLTEQAAAKRVALAKARQAS